MLSVLSGMGLWFLARGVQKVLLGLICLAQLPAMSADSMRARVLGVGLRALVWFRLVAILLVDSTGRLSIGAKSFRATSRGMTWAPFLWG